MAHGRAIEINEHEFLPLARRQFVFTWDYAQVTKKWSARHRKEGKEIEFMKP